MKIYLDFVMDFEKQAYDGGLRMDETLKSFLTEENKEMLKTKMLSLASKVIDEGIEKLYMKVEN
jgi:hypothetical protein